MQWFVSHWALLWTIFVEVVCCDSQSRVAVRGNSSTSLSPSDKITLDDDRPQPNRSPPRVQKGHSYATKQSMPFLEKADEDD